MTRHSPLQAPVGPGAGASNAVSGDRSAPEHWSLGTMLDVVRWRAARQPNELAYTFLLDAAALGDEQATAQFTYADLDRRARAIAAHLQQRAAGRGSIVGERALVVLEPGLDYIAALFGCFYAGVVPAPVYPPDPFRIARTLPRLQAIFGSADCQFLLSSGAILGDQQSTLRQTCPRGAVEIETIVDEGANDWREIDSNPNQLALLQYTSGTTGEPRGVPITHANLIANLRGMAQELDVEDAVAMFWLPPYHDLGLIGGVFLPLFASRHTVLMSPLDFMRSPANWLRAISHYRATTSAAPNFGYELCVRKMTDADCEGLDLSNWQVAVSGAEPVRADTLDRFHERFAPYGFRREAFVPAYGMAETTLMVSVGKLGESPAELELDADALARSQVKPRPGGRRLVGCGPAGPGVEIEIVDPESRQPTHGVGEVWVRSPSVASGYWQKPDLSAEQFGQSILSPRDSQPGAEESNSQNAECERRFLRTGDLGFVRDGQLFLVGRRKEMIILAGRNFYPQDIELAVQSSHPAFKPDGGAAVAVEADNSERLVLLQEVQRPRKQDLDELLTLAQNVCLEETGQSPLRVVLLPVGELPKTSSGKTRRADCWKAIESGELTILAEWPAGAENTEAVEFEKPIGETETWLASAWCDILGLVEVGRRDNFFALGGRSLQVTQMLTGVAERTGLVLPLKTLFDHPTLAQLARHIDQQPKQTPDATAPFAAIDLNQPQPLSPTQQRFWLVEQLGVPGGANVPLALRMNGQIDRQRLDDALARLIARHDALRIAFAVGGTDVTQQLGETKTPAIASLTVAGDPPDEQLLEHALELPWVWKPFDLSAAPLARVAIVDTPGGDQILLLVLHHLICDGSSIGLLLDDLTKLYNQQQLPPPTSYAEYLAALPNDLAPETDYWRQRLANVPPSLDLPLDAPSDATAERGQVDIASRELDQTICERIDRLASQLAATPFLILLSAYHIVLSRYSGQTDIGVGAAVAGRGARQQDVVGCLINTAPLFANISPSSDYAAFLQQLRDDLLSDLDHAALPWEEIVGLSDKPRVPGRMPLVQAFFVHDDRPMLATQFGESAVVDAATDYRGLGVFDLSLVVETSRQKPRVKLIHNPHRFPTPLAERLLDSFCSILQAIDRNPNTPLRQLPVPAEAEAKQLELGSEPTHYQRSRQPAHVARRFAQQAAQTPNELAVVCGYDTLTFTQLADRSRQVAARLATHGVRPGDRVGLMLQRTVDLPAVMLGVWQAGAAYVPLDPAYPAERLEFMADDAQLACLLIDRELSAQAPHGAEKVVVAQELLDGEREADESKLPALDELSGEQLAYLMYTSGSTGKPKGVMAPHRAVANLLDSFAQDTQLGVGNAMLGATTISFDISVLELFLPLVTGARLVLANSLAAGDAGRLTALLAMTDVSHIQGAPSTLRMLLSAGWRPRKDQTILCGGEELPPDLAQQLAQTAGELWNVYGPTETTIWSTMTVLGTPTETIPIGRPIAGTRCYIFGCDQQLAPTGVWGELAIAGDGVTDGYWNRPELTAERFPADPFATDPNARMYLTGDTARWNADGMLEFGGRKDGQVKVRGHRIELREIEISLATHQAIHEAAVVATGQGEQTAALVAYVSPVNGSEWSPAMLLEHLASRLPAYMAPSTFVELESLPRTDNGKIDRNALPHNATAARSRAIVEPRTPLEQQLADWVMELLQIERVGVFDNFFELGGQSLLATQLVVRMRDELGVEPPLREVYQRPTIAQWAELVLKCELEAKDNVARDLLDQLDGMTDDQAAALLDSLGDE